MLDGKFSFVVYDDKNKRIYAGRDHMGICPMYIGYGKDGSVWFASEMKARPSAFSWWQKVSLGPTASKPSGGIQVATGSTTDVCIPLLLLSASSTSRVSTAMRFSRLATTITAAPAPRTAW